MEIGEVVWLRITEFEKAKKKSSGEDGVERNIRVNHERDREA